MKEVISISIFVILFILVIAGNILWYQIKNILSKNGFKVNYWSGHLNDIFNFKKLIRKTKNIELEIKYKKMLNGLIIILISFLTLSFLIFTDFAGMDL